MDELKLTEEAGAMLNRVAESIVGVVDRMEEVLGRPLTSDEREYAMVSLTHSVARHIESTLWAAQAARKTGEN